MAGGKPASDSLFLDMSSVRSEAGNGKPPSVRVFLDRFSDCRLLHDAKNAWGSVPLKAFDDRSTSTRAHGGDDGPWKALPPRRMVWRVKGERAARRGGGSRRGTCH